METSESCPTGRHVVIEDGRRVLADYNVAPHLE
jgi:hypothetical protein